MSTNEPSNGTASPYFPGVFRKDFIASIVVFLVALPLCIGIAVAVGVNPARALITGIIGGLVVGIFSGSPLQVSGPAAGLFVIVADIIAQQKAKFLGFYSGPETGAETASVTYALAALGFAVLLAGVIQIIAGRLMIGRWFQAVSPAVINGMLAGIGVLIMVSQFHVMLDHEALWHGHKAHGGLEYMATIPEAIWKCFTPEEAGHVHHLAAAIGIVTIATMLFWQSLAPKKLQLIPAALLGIMMATIIALVWNFPLKQLSVPQNLLDEVSFLNATPEWMAIVTDSSLYVSALVIALIGSAETLLCATALDKMKQGHKTNHDKELTAQGIGNVLCGLVGALPMTGVIVRSSANVNAGGQTRGATILHGGWLLLFIVLLPSVLTMVPKAALGALLVYTGFKLLNIKQIKELYKTSWSEFAIYATTIVLIVSFDLLVGVVAGIVLSAIKLLVTFTRFEADLIVNQEEKTARLSLNGAATFLRLPILTARLEEIPEDADLHIDLTNLSYVDHACFETLIDWAKQHEKSGGRLSIDWSQLHGKFQKEVDIRAGEPLPAPHSRGGGSEGKSLPVKTRAVAS
ncbi:SulP family inorganic anion transporter [Blastopirellula marina]|uniref:SulP family inorganic anion transporter n=1 Tax=Blastopirellula marina TaxID=124 RepID=A0A2S8G0N4_9BACT|nr:SulP family inorganic anion transporter [Blastopirellula marina]PQO37993.1 SulP family inorganic anion transporter [Blastopirellula marina]PTL44649.1 SulP family inorganic anion transporter [Blastopirellula marina]